MCGFLLAYVAVFVGFVLIGVGLAAGAGFGAFGGAGGFGGLGTGTRTDGTPE